MIRAMLIAMFAVLAAPVAAQTVTFQSGAHPGFTRLVMTLPRDMSWSIGRMDRGYLFRPEATHLEYDTSGIFEMIPSTRITAVVPDPISSDLSIELGCDCHAGTYAIDDRYLVIDIRDGAPGPNAQHEERLLSVSPSFEFAKHAPVSALPPQSDMPPAIRGSDRPFAEIPTLSRVQRLSGEDLLPSIPETENAPSIPLPRTESVQSEALRFVLAEALARAAAEGLVDPAQQPMLPLHPPELDGDARQFHDNIRVETAFDRALGAGDALPIQPIEGNPDCQPSHAFAVPDWGNDRSPVAAIAHARKNLIDARGQPDAAAATAFAKLYIHLSFGAEARQILAVFGADDPQSEVLIALAGLVDGTFGSGSDALETQIHCGGAPALWAFLDMPQPEHAGSLDADAMLLAHAALPARLRRVVGPELGLRFLAVGDQDAALIVYRTLPPGEYAANGPQALFAAALAEQGLRLENRTALADVSASSLPEAADAVLTLLETDLAAGRAVDLAAVESAAILAFERDGTPEAVALKRAEIRGRLNLGDVDAAISVLEAAMRDRVIPAEVSQQLWPQVLRTLAAAAPDPVFTRHAFSERIDPLFSASPSDAQHAILARLVALGFPDRAEHLGAPLFAEGDSEAMRLRAELALLRGNSAGAVAHLADLDGPQIRRLEAEALLELGDPDQAFTAARAAGVPALETRAALRAAQWQWLSQSSDPALRAASARRLAGVPQHDVQQLSSLAVLAEESTATRDDIAALLATVPRP